jgi:hypothetical protein
VRCSTSIWHWLVALAYLASVTVPFFKIFPRAGIPGWVGPFDIIPLAPLVFLWVFAFMKWPQDKGSPDERNAIATVGS